MITPKIKTRHGVTLLEVMFAMFVVLFGLVGMVALLPMATRQAADSYAMTHASAVMDNAAAEFVGAKLFQPTPRQQWWLFNDVEITVPPNLPPIPLGPLHTPSIAEMLIFNQRTAAADTTLPPNPFPVANIPPLEYFRREGLAKGFCIDPMNMVEGLHHGDFTPRGMGEAPFARRTRMPFYDETTWVNDLLAPTARFNLGNAYTPRLLRVSYASSGNLFLPIAKPLADNLVSSLGDLNQADAVEDDSFGPLRNFYQSGGVNSHLISSLNSNRISWMAGLTPSEETAAGQIPNQYNLTFVVFSNRDVIYEFEDPDELGMEAYPKGERLAAVTGLTEASGQLEVMLQSDMYTDTRIRIGDWVMLSRRIVLGNDQPIATFNSSKAKIIHRHRWYRVIGADNLRTWPRVIRLQGPSWDYPENDPNTQSINVDLASSPTTATLFSNVVSVYRQVVSVDVE